MTPIQTLSQPFTVRDIHHSLVVQSKLLLPLLGSSGTEEARWCGEVERPSTRDGERLFVGGGPWREFRAIFKLNNMAWQFYLDQCGN